MTHVGRRNPSYKHGAHGTRLYRIWKDMRNRCNNRHGKDYKNYGGRGIRVCMRWNNFVAFAKDMGPHPGKGLTLDRKKNSRGYNKTNCRWTTRLKQNRNRRTRSSYPPRGPNGWI